MGVITINNYSVTGDCGNLGLGEVFFNITGDSPGWAVSEISTSGLLPTSATTNTYYVNNLPAGSYFVEVIDSAFSTTILPIYISSGTCVSIDVNGTNCGFDNGTLTATTENVYGPIDFYLYDISDTLVYSAIGVSNDYVFNSLSADTYYVVADDGGGCSGRSETCIINTSTPISYGFYVVNDANCVSTAGSGKIFITGLTGNAPFTYLWSNGETTASVENLLPGVYSVTITDSNGCELTQSTTITKVSPVQFGSFIVTQPTCFNNDGEVEVTIVDGTAPYYFSGSNGQTIVTFSQTYTFTNLNAGPFSVFVQDAGLCSFINSTSLITPNSFSVTSVNTTNSSCNNNNGKIDIILNNSVPAGTFTYSLTDSSSNTVTETTSLVVFSFENLPSDTYTLTITDGTCTYTTTVTITNVQLFTISAVTTGTTCGFNNGSVQILASTGGTLPYSYQITGQPPSSQTIFNNLSSGTYTATVTDNNGCSQTEIFNITPSTGVFFDFSLTQPTNGNDGEIDVLIYNGEPPFTYSWSPNVGIQTGLSVVGLSAGTYSLQITDNNGCVYSKNTTLQGTNLISTYQVYNICDTQFQNTSVFGKRGILQMYNEGFYDLTLGDTNCIINSADFILEITVDGELKTINFYTSTGIDDYPSDVDWVNIITDTLKTFYGIGDIVVDYQKNTIQIFNTCITGTTCNPGNTNLLSDAKITINLVIDYDISCVSCQFNCELNSFCDVDVYNVIYPLTGYDFLDDITLQPTYNELNNYVCGTEVIKGNDFRINRDQYFKELNENKLTKYVGYYDNELPNDLTLLENYLTNPNNYTIFYKGGFRNVNMKWWSDNSSYPEWFIPTCSGKSLNDIFVGVEEFTFLHPVDNIGLAPIGVPGNIIKSTGITNSEYYWSPLNNNWTEFNFNCVDMLLEDFLSLKRSRQVDFVKQKNQVMLALRPYLYAAYYLPNFQMIKYKNY